MKQDVVIGHASQAMWMALKVSLPVMAATLGVGVLISALQAVTQINEATLNFVPKALALMAVLAIAGPWMLNTMVGYTAILIESLPALAR
jgi:flagellar biosynthetic protein FliQ